MKFVACRNITNVSDTLYVNYSIINDAADLLTLVNNWLVDRGCDDKVLLDKVGKALSDVYKGKYTTSEHHHDLFQVNIYTDKINIRYTVIFKYSIIGELTYKEIQNENKN